MVGFFCGYWWLGLGGYDYFDVVVLFGVEICVGVGGVVEVVVVGNDEGWVDVVQFDGLQQGGYIGLYMGLVVFQ